MKAQDLKNSILQMAMEGKLVPQDPNDEPASVLLEKIKEEKEQLIKEKKIKRNNKESIIFRKNNQFYEKVGKKGEEVCIDDEILFEIPDSWEWCRFHNVLNIVSARRVHKSDWKSEGIPFYRAREIGKLADNDFVDNELFISQELYEEFKTSGVPKANDLMVTGVGTLGKVYIVKENDCFYYKDASVLCFENFGKLNPIFLKYFMNSPFSVKQIKENSSGTTVATITMKKANNYLIPLPPLNEQKRIVDKIEELLPLIKNYNSIEEKLNDLNTDFPDLIKKSILQEAIQGKLVPQDPNDEPASVLLEKIKEEKEQLIKEKKIKRNKNESIIYRENNHFYKKIGKNEPICIDDEIPFEIPESWEWCCMNQYLDVRDGTHDTPKYVDKGVPLVTSKNLKNNSIDFSAAKFISEEDHKQISLRSKVDNNDILFAMIGSIGNPTIVSKDKEFSIKNVGLFKPIVNEINMNYVFYYLSLAQYEMQKNASGAVQSFVSLSVLRNYYIPVPPLNEQNRIVEKLTILEEKLIN